MPVSSVVTDDELQTQGPGDRGRALHCRLLALEAAFRSGDYEPRLTPGDDGVPVFIVAFDIYHLATGQGEWLEKETGPHFRLHDWDHDGFVLPHKVRTWFGIRGPKAGFYDQNDAYQSLVGMHMAGAGFSDIADVIGRRPKGFLTFVAEKKIGNWFKSKKREEVGV